MRRHGPIEPGRTQNSTAVNGAAPDPLACAVNTSVDCEPDDVSSRRIVSGVADWASAHDALVDVES